MIESESCPICAERARRRLTDEDRDLSWLGLDGKAPEPRDAFERAALALGEKRARVLVKKIREIIGEPPDRFYKNHGGEDDLLDLIRSEIEIARTP